MILRIESDILYFYYRAIVVLGIFFNQTLYSCVRSFCTVIEMVHLRYYVFVYLEIFFKHLIQTRVSCPRWRIDAILSLAYHRCWKLQVYCSTIPNRLHRTLANVRRCNLLSIELIDNKWNDNRELSNTLRLLNKWHLRFRYFY